MKCTFPYTNMRQNIGVALLVVFALAKLHGIERGINPIGFIGGPIFPLLFVGSTMGTAIHLGSSPSFRWVWPWAA